MSRVRLLPAAIVVAFLLLVFTLGIADNAHRLPWMTQPDVVFPNFSHYKLLQTLPQSHVPIHPDDNRRIIVIGDIHGMNHSLSALLAKISYDPQLDTLIHLGDLISKDAKLSSDPVLEFMSTNNILGVRGNNDQKVIEWRAWMDWIISLPGGREWLEDMDLHSGSAKFDMLLKKSHRKWLAYVPSDWILLGKHYVAARDMTQHHYNYLRSLPLVLHAPTAHTFFVHAGLLPADPTRDPSDPSQPLSHFPTTPNPVDDTTLRELQELALLDQVPQNHDPWVLMNIRGLTKHGKVKAGNKGTPWSDAWNDAMDNCHGLPARLSKHGSKTRTLHCFPSTVVYGHAAVRDLDVKRWSVGIDTGCTYGRRLTAIILDHTSFSSQTHLEMSDRSLKASRIPYGDAGTAQITSVKCRT